ncbi:hypothetical protein Tco_0105383 [Tanacetum coccineum]
MHPVDPPSPDYVPGPEELKQAPLLPDYVPGSEYPEYLALSDEEVPVEDQPYDVAGSPIALSLGYIADSDLEEDPKDESEDGPTDYPTDGGDDDDDDSSGDDADNEDEEEASEEDEDEEGEEEHLALTDSTAAASPVIPSPPFLVPSPPTTSPTYTEAPLCYRAAGIWLSTASPPPLPLSSPLPLPPPIILPRTRASMVLMRAAAPSTYILAPRSRTPPSRTPTILPIPLPTSSLPLSLPSTDRRADVPEAVLPPQKRLCIALGPRFEVEECSFAAAARSTRGFREDYGFVGTLDAEIRRDPDRERVTDFVTIVRQDTDEIYVRLDDAQSDQSLMTGQFNVACAQSMDASHRARYEVMTLQTTVSALQTENEELRAADRKRQTQLLETLTQVRALQNQIIALQRQRTEDSDRMTQHIQHEHDRFKEFCLLCQRQFNVGNTSTYGFEYRFSSYICQLELVTTTTKSPGCSVLEHLSFCSGEWSF